MRFLWLVCLLGSVSGEPVVEIQDGKIEGEVLMTVRGAVPYSSFRSIPYAQPPVGPLRFKRPLPAEPWNGTLDARHDAMSCKQAQNFLTEKDDEDCLYLNVYTPKTDFSNTNREKMAVIVVIHGGGFTIGSGSRHWYGPDFFMEENVVMVTLNYRLGVFGFLSFLTKEFPGNLGLWDQVTALLWVKNNIAVFGGDPSKVTIIGQSAGAASVHAHILSDASRDLFHKAISQSGTMMSPWAITRKAVKRSRKLAEAVNCFSPDMASMEKCLVEASAESLIRAATFEVFSLEDFTDMDIFPFIPVMDGNITSIEPFFTEWPEVLMKTGDFNKVPYICGINSNELLVFFLDPRSEFQLNSNEIARQSLFKLVYGVVKSHGLPDISEIDDILKFNITEQGLILKSLAGIIKSASDVAFRLPAVLTMELQSEHCSWQFVYEFGFEGELGIVKRNIIEPIRKIPGVPHIDDIFYMYLNNLTDILPEIDPAMITLRRMVRMWTNFAKFSDPTPDPFDTLLNVHWDTYSNREKRYLAIGKELNIGCDLTVNGECGLSTTTPESTATGGEDEEEGFKLLECFTEAWLVLAGALAVVSLYFVVRYLCLRRSPLSSFRRL